MTNFKVGDKVRRIGDSLGKEVVEGGIYEISHIKGSFLCVKGCTSSLYASKFELVEEKSRPWLKVIPPQPEKRELRNATLKDRLHIMFSGEALCYLSTWDSAALVSFTKDELRSLGETLIEISKEMK